MSGSIRTAYACAVGLGLGALLVGAAPAHAQSAFIGIGHVPGDPESKGLAISADGSVVVGSSYYSGTAEHAYRWTAATGLRLITTPGFELNTTAYAASGDGLLMGGNTNNLIDSPAWSWTEAGGAVTLFNRGTIRAASTTGDVLAGYTMDGGTHSLHAVRWTGADGVRSLEPNGQTISHSQALGLNADGTLAVGQAIFPTINSLRAFLWSAATGMQNIGSTDPAGHPSRAWAITRDGAAVVGGAQFLGMPLDAFRWTSAGGMQDLGSLSSIDDTDALAVSDDGNTVVGTCGKTLAGTLSGQAFVWHPAIGLRNLQTFLGALVPTGWTLIEARGVSADGTVITGWGRNPLNQTEGWIVRLPGGVTAVGDPAPASSRSLTLAAFPNPVLGTVRLAAGGVTSAAAEPVLTIFDAAGRVARQFAAGGQAWSWNARDASGARVPAGIYFAELRSGAARAVQKLVVLQ